MKNCDILIAGASTTGSYFAYQMAKRGFKVVVIEKQEKDNISREYDIFHMGKEDMIKFDLEIPDKENKKVYGFEFASTAVVSPYGNYPKRTHEAVVGMHKHEYIMTMIDRAEKAGAEYIYGAPFKDFIYDEQGRIAGAKYETENGVQEISAKLVADCTGIPAAARTKLPDTSFVENFKLTPKDIFYVVLYYAKYKDEKVDPTKLHGSFLQYKTWSAPSGDDHGAILGVGGNFSYDYAEEVYKDFRKNVPWPEYTVEKVEKGMTPYHRGIYCFTEDGFIALGDTACLTKPNCGEGCTSSLYQVEIAVDVITDLLNEGKELTQRNMWSINKRYIDVQGKAFDSMRPLLTGIVQASYDEAEYLFKKDIIFSQKILGGMGQDLALNAKDIAELVSGIASGIATKKLRPSTLKKIVKGLLDSDKVGKHYDTYPETPDSFPEWKKKADEIWATTTFMYETADKDVMKKLGIG